ncbi:MAG: succinate dehydrogenase assembly factor 2 [Moraxella sp.]|nr:succinate dehydrogenase assembly factor 2 [Moraxella sp.]
MNKEPTLHQRRIIYQARRGLKELDFYIDPYVKEHYLMADDDEQMAFERLLAHEDPDLLLFFLGQATPDDAGVASLIDKIKALKYAN